MNINAYVSVGLHIRNIHYSIALWMGDDKYSLTDNYFYFQLVRLRLAQKLSREVTGEIMLVQGVFEPLVDYRTLLWAQF